MAVRLLIPHGRRASGRAGPAHSHCARGPPHARSTPSALRVFRAPGNGTFVRPYGAGSAAAAAVLP